MDDLDGATRQDEASAINTKDLMIQAQDEWDIVSEVMDRSVHALTTSTYLYGLNTTTELNG